MVGFFGGTFDPVHEGHVLLARVALARYPFRKIYLVPARQNPLKLAGPSAGADDRLAMLRAATTETGESRLEVLDWELRAPGPSFTIHTVERLMAQERGAITLLMGNEVFASLPRWHEGARLVSLADFIVVMREGTAGFAPRTTLEALGVRDAADEGSARVRHTAGSRWVDRMDMVALPISATRMRERLVAFSRDSQSTPPGISRAVWGYIKEKRLYTVSKEAT